jgi:cobalamin biosynthesis Mg chelatase CobN
MTTDKSTNTNNTVSTTEQHENKQELNQKTSVQFVTSVTVGVLLIILVAASAYFGIVRF